MRWYARPENDSLPLRMPPRLASWNKADDPDQVRLREYLDDTEVLLGASRVSDLWAIRLDVGLDDSRDLLDAADLDNYAYPLASRMKNPDLVSVWCTKQHSATSLVRIEAARELPSAPGNVVVAHTTGSASTVAFKEQIRASVTDQAELPDGPVRLELSFVVGPARNWLNLWKQTIDSLDPFLGRTYPDRLWHPRDGRITELGMHVTVDPLARNSITVGISASAGQTTISADGHDDPDDNSMAHRFDTHVREFRDDDAGYLDWLASHPDGHVLNIARGYSPASARVHHAGCRTISGENPRQGPWTAQYVKVCAEAFADLHEWSITNVRQPILSCGTCRPGPAS